MSEPVEHVVMCHDGTLSSVQSTVAGKELAFSENGVFKTKNRELADEVKEKYKGHIIVAHRPTVRYGTRKSFGQWPEMPYKKVKDEKPDDSPTSSTGLPTDNITE